MRFYNLIIAYNLLNIFITKDGILIRFIVPFALSPMIFIILVEDIIVVGVNCPYNVRERVTAGNQSPSWWYVHSGTNTIEPDKISILNYAGLDRSISIDAIQKAEVRASRPYRMS